MIRTRLLAALAALLALTLPALAGVLGSDYVANGTCGPFPRAAVTTLKGACVGIVAGPADGLIMPRSVIEASPGRLIVTDLGDWDRPRGRLIDIRLTADGKRTVTTLIAGLDRPHGLAMGGDGKIYVGEATVIWRFNPNATGPVRKEVVIDRLPGNGRHPLKVFAFDPKGDLVINFGSPTDRCETNPNNLSVVQYPCANADGESPQGALWLLEFDKPNGVKRAFRPIARGLRNSMALAINELSGVIVQGENNIDLKPVGSPPEELNVISRRGRALRLALLHLRGRGARL